MSSLNIIIPKKGKSTGFMQITPSLILKADFTKETITWLKGKLP